jgi:hypothetical protein
LSNPQPNTVRTVIETERFSTAFQALSLSYQRLDEVMVGLTHALCVKPEECPVITGTKLSLITTRAYGKVPALRIFFTFNDNEVLLQHVELIGGSTAPQATTATSA